MAKKTTTKSSSSKKSAAAKTKASTKSRTSTKKTSPKSSSAGEKEVTIDRRRQGDRRDEVADAKPKVERRKKVQRRRQIDPTTCERDYSVQEVEFMNALDEYKRASGRMFPTCSEVLEVIRNLGYVQLSPAELAARNPVEPVAEESSEADPDQESSEEEELELVGQTDGAY